MPRGGARDRSAGLRRRRGDELDHGARFAHCSRESPVVDMCAARSQTCVVLADGALRCWDASAAGRLRRVSTMAAAGTTATSPQMGAIASTAASSGIAATVRSSGPTKRGVTSLGLISTAQPASSAGIASISVNVSGKFHGLITPTSAYGTYCGRNTMAGLALAGCIGAST